MYCKWMIVYNENKRTLNVKNIIACVRDLLKEGYKCYGERVQVYRP